MAAQLPGCEGCTVGVGLGVTTLVVGAGFPPLPPVVSLPRTNCSACWPYLTPYCWCRLASLPVQQYGSGPSQ